MPSGKVTRTRARRLHWSVNGGSVFAFITNPLKTGWLSPGQDQAQRAADPQPLAASRERNHSLPYSGGVLSRQQPQVNGLPGISPPLPLPPGAHGRGEDLSLRVHHAGFLPGDDGNVHHERGKTPDLHHLLHPRHPAHSCGHHLEHVPVLPEDNIRPRGPRGRAVPGPQTHRTAGEGHLLDCTLPQPRGHQHLREKPAVLRADPGAGGGLGPAPSHGPAQTPQLLPAGGAGESRGPLGAGWCWRPPRRAGASAGNGGRQLPPPAGPRGRAAGMPPGGHGHAVAGGFRARQPRATGPTPPTICCPLQLHPNQLPGGGRAPWFSPQRQRGGG